MDPFEPLGIAFRRKLRHVPYVQDYGMTEYHADHLRFAGGIIVVICTTENVINHKAQAFELQAKFVRDIQSKVRENPDLANVPVIVLLITNGAGRQAHEAGLNDIPAIVTCNNYTTSALENAVRVMLGN
jgi:hypothetical protein